MEILNVKQLKQLTTIDLEVSNRASKVLEILDSEYGIDRKLSDNGGYVLVVQDNNQDDIKKINEFLDLYGKCIVEYFETFTGDDSRTYCELLMLLSNDYGVTLYMIQELFKKYESNFRWD